MSSGVLTSHWLIENTADNPSPERILSTTDVAVAADGTIYVVDRHEARVLHFDTAGVLLREWGRSGDGPGEFRLASAVALGPDQRVYVGDRRRVTVFSSDGAFIRTFSVPSMRNISDLAVMPNRNVMVATDAYPGESIGPYVAIVDSTGALVRNVLSALRPEAGHARPLLGSQINLVRLTAGPHGHIAVWYPMDNYVEIFDSAGTQLSHIEGCLPERIIKSYASQARSGSKWQTSRILTLGVSFDSRGGMQVASLIHRPDNGRAIRLRHYSSDSEELEARDFDVSGDRFFHNGLQFLRDSDVITFSTGSFDQGIRQLRLQ